LSVDFEAEAFVQGPCARPLVPFTIQSKHLKIVNTD
jgi:hypothetical protein